MKDYAYLSGKFAVIRKTPSACDEIKRLRTRLSQKRATALEVLGKNWVCHPDYQYQARHSFSRAEWYPNRALQEIALIDEETQILRDQGLI
jgi:hypothetical protein